MALVKIENPHGATAELSRPDGDGDYSWTCSCGDMAESFQPLADAVADAKVHVDRQCNYRFGSDR